MEVIQRAFQVKYDLRVYFTEEAFGLSNPLLRDLLSPSETKMPAKVLAVLDEALAAADPHLAKKIEAYFAASDRLKLVAAPTIIEGGERAKNSDVHVKEIHLQVDRYGICRHSYILAIGGGALLDVVGLAAATAHRGVRLVRIPTTTLSQDDSGVGVKNGINCFGKKNFFGTFAPPFAVINDFSLLRTLPARDKRAGYIEAVKVALIRDAAFFEALEKDAESLREFEPEAMKRLIRRCAELHVNHIATSGDPFEFGSARPLDFGHWAAHKLEQLSNYKLRHGEAVAIGIALDVIYSRRAGYLGAVSADRILALIERLGFEMFAHELLHADNSGALMVLRGMEEFREHLGGELTLTLLQEIGRGFETHELHLARVVESIQELRDRYAARLGAPTLISPPAP